MKTLLLMLTLVLASTQSFAQDALDLHAVAMPHSPPVADWAPTIRITQLDMDPRGGIALTFDQAIPERWKWFSNPAEPQDNYQFTVWACVERTYCAGFVEMWAGRSMTDGSLPAILSGYTNWWGDVRHLWDNMSDYRPQPGDEVDFLITAGNGRLVSGVTSVAERSNVVAIRLPAGDSGHFVFGAAPPPVVVTPPVVVPPPPVVVPPSVIVPPSPAPLPSTDIAMLFSQSAINHAAEMAQLDELKSQVASLRQDIDDFQGAVKSKWLSIMDSPIVKYGLAILTGVILKYKLP